MKNEQFSHFLLCPSLFLFLSLSVCLCRAQTQPSPSPSYTRESLGSFKSSQCCPGCTPGRRGPQHLGVQVVGISGTEVPQEAVLAARTESGCPGGFSVGETPSLFYLSLLLFLHFSPCLDQFPLGYPLKKRRKIPPAPLWMCLSSGITPRAGQPHPWAELIHNTAGKASARSTRHVTPSAVDQRQTQHFSAALLGKQKETSP